VRSYNLLLFAIDNIFININTPGTKNYFHNFNTGILLPTSQRCCLCRAQLEVNNGMRKEGMEQPPQVAGAEGLDAGKRAVLGWSAMAG
jgi:hypothetical protein